MELVPFRLDSSTPCLGLIFQLSSLPRCRLGGSTSREMGGNPANLPPSATKRAHLMAETLQGSVYAVLCLCAMSLFVSLRTFGFVCEQGLGAWHQHQSTRTGCSFATAARLRTVAEAWSPNARGLKRFPKPHNCTTNASVLCITSETASARHLC